ncbi:MAG: radical SAM protein [Candidatus Thorarchaeota archaeon]
MIFSNYPSVIKPNYIAERNGFFLLIWDFLPHWMVIDKEANQLISLADGTRSLKQIVQKINMEDNNQKEQLIQAKTVLKSLKTLGLLKSKEEITPDTREGKDLLENITINITNVCNLRCKHCYIRNIEKKDNFPLESFKNFVNEASNESQLSKELNLAILGGEPLLEKEKTLEIAKFGKMKGYDTIVSTNGLLIDSKFAKQAEKYQLTVQVSLEGSTRDVNDSIRGDGTFNKAKTGIGILVQNQVYTIISMVVQESNFHDIENLYHFGVNLGVNEVRYIPLKIMGAAKVNLNPVKKIDILHSLYTLVKKYKNAKRYLKRDFYSIMKMTCAHSYITSHCGTGLKTVLIDANGDVYPCPNHRLPEFNCGNISNGSFKEIWLESPILLKLRKTYNIETINSECSNCVVRYWCLGGCRGETYENTNNLTSKAIDCKDMFESIIETFWILSQEKLHKYPKKREYF